MLIVCILGLGCQMHQGILESIVYWVISVIQTVGYPGVFFLMLLESALIPIPSEVIMPFSGFLVSQGKLSFWLVVSLGALGNLAGSLVAYALGYYGEKTLIRNLIKKYGKFILITEAEFDSSLRLFGKYGQWVAAVSRVLPGLRTVISLPAGIAKLPVLKFAVLTLIGSFIWSAFLTYVGVKLGENWVVIRPIFHKFDILIVVAAIILVGVYLYHKFLKKETGAKEA